MTTQTPRNRWSRCLVGLVLVAGVSYFLAKNAGVVATTLAGIGSLALLPLLAGVGLSVAAMTNRGLLNHAAQRAVGLRVEPLSMTRTTAVGFAANKVVKSGGASGLAVFLRHGRRRGHDGGAVSASCILTALAGFGAFGVLLISTLMILSASGRLTGWWLLAAGWFGIHGLALAALVFVGARHRDAAERTWHRLRRLRCRLLRRDLQPLDRSAIDALYSAIATARHESSWTRRMFGHAVTSKALGTLMLVAAAAATGLPLTLTGAIVIYATALTASSVSFVPGGIGVVETSTGAALIGAGAPVATAALTVALFRIFDMWLPVATGAFLGRNELRAEADSDLPPEETAPSSRRPSERVILAV